MDRRGFLRSMLGVAAVTALPSEVFPFRKIFLPPMPKWFGVDWGFGESTVVVTRSVLDEACIEAIELEAFAKEIPDLIFRSTSLYKAFKKKGPISSRINSAFRVPVRFEAVDKSSTQDIVCADAANKILEML
jgi:hypothetical protein